MATVNASVIPNAETVAAMQEVEGIKARPENYKGYSFFQELLREILNDEESDAH